MLKQMTLTAAIVGVSACASADTIYKARLGDHPDATQNPPPYGLRLDNLFLDSGASGARGGVTTFSMSAGSGVHLTVDRTGSTLTINISGEVIGGEENGSGGPGGFGTGSYQLDFTYTSGVIAFNGGWLVIPTPTSSGFGSLTANFTGTGITAGDEFFFGQDGFQGGAAAGGYPLAAFAFMPDGYRLGGGTDEVGRGWLANMDANGNIIGGNGTQDFLFTVIPLPTTSGLALAGLGLIALRRRR